MKQLFVILSCIALVQSTTPNARIVGGFSIDIRDVPFQVSLQKFGHFCGGSAIGERWILTAAHCANERDVPSLEVRIGSSHHASGGTLVKVTRVFQHPSFNGATFDYDFFLLELAEPLQLTEEFYAVNLPEQDDPVQDGVLLQVSGWGNTLNTEESNEVLRAVNVTVVNQEECRQAYLEVSDITERMLCAGGGKVGGKDHCYGDSGGPLVPVGNSTLVGVVSWGLGCASPYYPGVYGRVAAVREWIREQSGI